MPIRLKLKNIKILKNQNWNWLIKLYSDTCIELNRGACKNACYQNIGFKKKIHYCFNKGPSPVVTSNDTVSSINIK